MKIFGLILLVLVFAAVLVYADGARLPVNHSVSVTGVVPAPPDKVFARIADVANGAAWRPEVKSVTVLAPVPGPNGRRPLGRISRPWPDHDLPRHPQEAPTRRDVQLDVPNGSYGGTWTYELSPGPAPATTTLRITETGFIHPPLYRFMMVHVFGPTRNLNQYMTDIQAAAGKP